MKLTGKTSVDDLEIGGTLGLLYNQIPEGDEWKVNFARDLINWKSDDVSLTKCEAEQILDEVTT